MLELIKKNYLTHEESGRTLSIEDTKQTMARD